jgi:hypothetical protein
MSAKNGFLEEQKMVELAERRSFSNRTEAPGKYSQRRERRGVSHPLWLVKNDSKRDFAGRLAKKTSADEGVEECCYCLVELSHNLFDVEAWRHYRKLGYESFEIYCSEVLHISAEQAERLKLIRDRCLPPRGKKGPWTVLQLGVSGSRDSGRREEKRLSLTTVSITAL